MLNKKAILLFSAGLDSTLALRIMQEQGIELEAINIRTNFACCSDEALEMARRFGVKTTMVTVGDDYFKMVEKPKHGWGKGINPCIDCRVYMFRMAKSMMDVCGASFVVTGEVLGQRPMSQQRHQLEIIEAESGLKDILLRPLSAKFLEPTLPEREEIVDREKLYGISGRSRKELIQLAEQYGIEDPPSPSTGCILTEPDFAKKVRDLFKHNPDYERWHFDVLQVGRHYRLDEEVQVVLGRDQKENDRLEVLHREDTALFIPDNFKGPSALVLGPLTEDLQNRVLSMALYYTKSKQEEGAFIFECRRNGTKETVAFQDGKTISEAEMSALRI